jgi:threonine/homoserine/homoserine lactone efflux protein
MLSFLISFFSGYVTSLVGTIIPGSMNAVAMELAVAKNKKSGLLFSLGGALVEMVYARLALLGVHFFLKEEKLFTILQWILISLFFAAGVYLFIRSFKKGKARKMIKKPGSKAGMQAFLLGIGLKAIIPAQVAFWIFWSTWLIANNLLKPSQDHYTVFCIGLGMATFTGYALYVFFGNYIESRPFFNQKIFNRIVGIFLCLSALFWVARLVWLE